MRRRSACNRSILQHVTDMQQLLTNISNVGRQILAKGSGSDFSFFTTTGYFEDEWGLLMASLICGLGKG